MKTIFLCPECLVASGALFLAAGKRCPRCGTSLDRASGTGYLGCADCLSYFGDDILPALDAFQGGAISRPDEKRKFIKIIKLQEEYDELSSADLPGDIARRAAKRRLAVLSEKLESLGVIVDG